jgi:CRISPR/Cas system CSM-associated protein Csm4 (group 5 of RAMP superfamily)
MVETHVRPICVLLLLNYISREAELILVPQTPSTKTEAGQQHLAQFNNLKKTTKIAQSEHRRIHRTSALLRSQDKSVSKKKHGRSSPVDSHPRPQPVADGTDTRTSIAFIGG